jgi:hypothetical protein
MAEDTGLLSVTEGPMEPMEMPGGEDFWALEESQVKSWVAFRRKD